MHVPLLIGCYPSTGAPASARGPEFDGAGVWRCSLDTVSGELSEPSRLHALPSASFLAWGPSRPSGERLLYAAVETESGHVASIEVDASLRQAAEVARVPTRGALPCHLLWLEEAERLLVSNYGDGSLSAFRLDPDGHPRSEPDILKGAGRGPDGERQAGPHAHSCARIGATSGPKESQVAVCDLGADALRLVDVSPGSVAEAREGVELRPGSGPRHLEVHSGGRWLYVTAELGGEVVVLEKSGAAIVERQRLRASCLDAPNLPSHLAFSADGQLLYVANRGPGTVATFAIGPDGLLRARGEIACGVPWPRHFAVVAAPDGGEYVVIAGQGSGRLTVLRRRADETVPSRCSSREFAAAPVCVLPA